VPRRGLACEIHRLADNACEDSTRSDKILPRSAFARALHFKNCRLNSRSANAAHPLGGVVPGKGVKWYFATCVGNLVRSAAR
jgi:hypothetical protein